jgi:hypothetical protein
MNKALVLGQVHRSSTKPGIKFPRQQRPDASSWKQWRRAIRLMFTAPCCTELRLLHPIRECHPLRYDSQLWTFYRVNTTLIVCSSFPSELRQFSQPSLHLCCFQFLKSSGQPIQSLPTNSVPVKALKQDCRNWILPVSAGIAAIVAPPPPNHPSHSRIESLHLRTRPLRSSFQRQAASLYSGNLYSTPNKRAPHSSRRWGCQNMPGQLWCQCCDRYSSDFDPFKVQRKVPIAARTGRKRTQWPLLFLPSSSCCSRFAFPAHATF